MTISFVPMAESAAQSQALVQFLTSNRFPFHVKAEHSQESARSLVEGARTTLRCAGPSCVPGS